jgi:hypothetical protein
MHDVWKTYHLNIWKIKLQAEQQFVETETEIMQHVLKMK